MRRTFLLLLLLLPLSAAIADGRQTFGYVEKARMDPGGLIFHSKLDTGADTSSLNAWDIRESEENGKKWLTFKVIDSYGKESTLKRELWRTVRIKRADAPSQIRKVIRVGICLGRTQIITNVTLIDRRNFNYQLLLGREYLASHALINPAVTFLTEPDCKDAETVQGGK